MFAQVFKLVHSCLIVTQGSQTSVYGTLRQRLFKAVIFDDCYIFYAMAERRQFLTGFATVGTVVVAGCILFADQEAVGEGFPPDSSELFAHGELQEHNFEASRFTEEDVGTDVSEVDLTNVDTSNVEDMRHIFRGAESFNQDTGDWDTSNVETMERMFDGALSFDQDIGGWDTSNVEDMFGMFRDASSFDQDIGDWDTSNVATLLMGSMFSGASSFDQDISGWCVEQIEEKPEQFDAGAGFEGDVARQLDWGEPC